MYMHQALCTKKKGQVRVRVWGPSLQVHIFETFRNGIRTSRTFIMSSLEEIGQGVLSVVTCSGASRLNYNYLTLLVRDFMLAQPVYFSQ